MLTFYANDAATDECSWLKAAIYYCDNYDAVNAILDTFDSADADAIGTAIEMFDDHNIKTDLSYIKTNFAIIIHSITKLETQGLPLNESMATLIDFKNSLERLPRKEFHQKMEAVLQRNPGFKSILEINNILHKYANSDDAHVQKLNPKELSSYKYCPLTSTDVERNFSIYGNTLTEKRHRFLFENLKHHMIVQCNQE